MVRLRGDISAVYIVDIDRRHGIPGNGQYLCRLLLAVISDKEDRVRLTAAECLLLLRDLALRIDSQQQIIAQMGIIAVFFAIVSDEAFVALALPCVRLLLLAVFRRTAVFRQGWLGLRRTSAKPLPQIGSCSDRRCPQGYNHQYRYDHRADYSIIA